LEAGEYVTADCIPPPAAGTVENGALSTTVVGLPIAATKRISLADAIACPRTKPCGAPNVILAPSVADATVPPRYCAGVPPSAD